MTGLTGLFRRGSTYYMRVVLPLDHPHRAERPTGRIVLSLGSSNYRDALSKGIAKRAEILAGAAYAEADDDHFIPHSLHSRDLSYNFVLAHPSCNRSKSDTLAAKAHLHRWLEFVQSNADDMSQIGY